MDTYLVRFFFLMPLACAFCVLLWAQVFFCCWFREVNSEEEERRGKERRNNKRVR